MGTETRMQGAQTVVGTPYYISPEMCEGKPYNEKSDIWALGCILYEMMCLQKTFEGTNLPALGEYDQVQGPYSEELKLLIREMLKLDPEQRPTAKDALNMIRKKQFDGAKNKNTTEFSDGLLNENIAQTSTRSALYKFDVTNITLSPAVPMPTNIKIKQVALSERHHLLVTADKNVYAWGDNDHGQLGLGDRICRTQPILIDSLSGKSVSKVALGATFSLFCTERGTVLFCGNVKYCGDGCKDHDVLKPALVDALLRVDVIDVACGDEHAVVVADDGKVFVWGSGMNGRLGTGNTEFVSTATQIAIPTQQMVVNVRCGPDATVLLTDCGSIIAMGSNHCNKLSLNHREGFFSNVNTSVVAVEEALTPTSVKAFSSRVVDIRLGRRHSGVLLESGNIHLFGENTNGELGLGHKNPVSGTHRPVKSLLSKTCLMIECGDGFSMAGTTDNELYFWGSKGHQVRSRLTVEDLEITCSINRPVESAIFMLLFDGSFHPAILVFSAFRAEEREVKSALVSKRPRKGEDVSESLENLLLQPSIVLRLEANDIKKTFITLSGLVCWKRNVMIIIETSLLHELKKGLVGRKTFFSLSIHHSVRFKSNRSGIPRLRNHFRRISAPELNNEASHVETWIQRELEEAEVLPINFKHEQTQHMQTRSLTGSQENSCVSPGTPLAQSPKVSDCQLLADIDNLRKQIDSGQEKKIFELQVSCLSILSKCILKELMKQHPAQKLPPNQWFSCGETTSGGNLGV
ncbi:unnamed protein product [Anisakis simplex]|uniref:non-specific serine/threonine protein kinase n=1 Tax=Anisakis simplex TaxID=6269 RepID=A0A0M3JSC2_ANISI|nr:unnamed protein product [Anisakis simplex]